MAGEGFPNPVAALFQAGNTLLINSSGIFLYNGIPAAGNLVGYWAVSPGTDAWGNPFEAQLAVGVASQPQVLLIPRNNAAAVIALPTNAADENYVANLYAVINNFGIAAQYLIAGITGPTNSNDPAAGGFQVQLTSGSDDATIPPQFLLFDNAGNYYLVAQYEAFSSPQLAIGATFAGARPVNRAPVQVTLNGALLTYGNAGQTVTKVHTSANSPVGTPFTIPIPAGVATANVECLAAAAGGQGVSGPGGGSGEYAAEPALAVTTAGITATLGAGGARGTAASQAGGPGGNTTAAGTSVTVTAHGAPANNNTGTGGFNGAGGGSGSINAVHRNGSGCGSWKGATNGGGSGAAAPSASAAGQAGLANTGSQPGGGTAPGAGGFGGSGGGGGWGSASSDASTTGGGNGGPGAGGGSGGAGPSGGGATAGFGGDGAIRVTYTLPGTAAILASLASVPGTDVSGSAFPAGFQGQITAVQPASSPSVPEPWHTVTPPANWTGLVRYRKRAENDVEVNIFCSVAAAAAAGTITMITLPSGYIPANNTTGGCGFFTNGPTTVAQMATIANMRWSANSVGTFTIQAFPGGAVGSGVTEIDLTIRYPLD